MSKKKFYAKLNLDFIEELSETQLKELIKKEVSTANSRIRHIKNEGLENSSSVMNKKYKALLYGSEFGTESGYFSKSVAHKTKEELQQQFLKIRNFLSEGITAEKVRNQRNSRINYINEKMGGNSLENAEKVENIISELESSGITATVLGITPSDLIAIVTSRVERGESEIEIFDSFINAYENYKQSDETLDILSEYGELLT